MKYMIFFSLLVLLSCSDDEPVSSKYQIHGIVNDYLTQSPYAGTKVILYTGTGIDPLNGYSFTGEEKDSVITDSEGNFSFRVQNENQKIYKLIVQKPGFLQVIPRSYIAGLLNSPLLTDTVSIGTSSVTRLNFSNSNTSEGDKIWVEIRYKEPSQLTTREIITSATLENQGLDPDNFSITREYFYELNKALELFISVTRLINDIEVRTDQTLYYNLAEQDTTTVFLAY